MPVVKERNVDDVCLFAYHQQTPDCEISIILIVVIFLSPPQKRP